MEPVTATIPRAATILEFSSTAEWRLLKRVAFRFIAAYLIVFNLPYQGHVNVLGPIPGSQFLTQPYIRGSRHIVEWIAAHVFHLTGPVAVYPRINGSGDTTLDYIHQLLMVVIALIATVVWSILDRKRPNYRRFHAWLRIWIRYGLLLTLFGYGFAKVFPLQFPPPYLARYIEPLSDFSPMGVLWTFMGVSTAYTIFSGAAEVTGGLLLMFRRTTTIGALVSAAVMLNIVMLNFCYDVPVKLYSTNLLLMAIFLAAPDLKRLYDAFVMNRAIKPSRVDTGLFQSRPARMAAIALKTVFLGYVLFLQIRGGIEGYRSFYTKAPRSPLYGIWSVETFAQSDQEVAGPARWRRVVMDRPQNIQIRRDDQPPLSFQTTYDGNRITLKDSGYLDYIRPDDSSLRLEGVIKGERVTMRLKKIDTSKYLLVSRGFHWINEFPFNR